MAKIKDCSGARKPCKSRESANDRVSKPRRQHAPQTRRPPEGTRITSGSNDSLPARMMKQVIEKLNTMPPGNWEVIFTNGNGRALRASRASPEPQECPKPHPLLNANLGRHPRETASGHRFPSGVNEPSIGPECQILKENSAEAGSIDELVDESNDESSMPDHNHYVRELVRVKDIGGMYKDMFRMLKQKGCKKVVQAWLRHCHHGKQAEYPYNGGTGCEFYADFDPENRGKHSAPPYWPNQDNYADPNSTGCRHKEPDHQKKHERLNLLCHLLSIGAKFGKKFDFSVDKLEAGTRETINGNKDHFKPQAAEILQDIYRARRMVERFHRGECDDNATISLLVSPPPGQNKTNRNTAPLLRNTSASVRDIERSSLSVGDEEDSESEDDRSLNSCSIKREPNDHSDTDSDIESIAYGYMDQPSEEKLPMCSTLPSTAATTVSGFGTSIISDESSRCRYPCLLDHRNGTSDASSSSSQSMQRKASGSTCTKLSQRSALSINSSSIASEPALNTRLPDMTTMQRARSSQSASGYLPNNFSRRSSENLYPQSRNVWNPNHAGEQLVTTTIRPKFTSSASTSSLFALNSPADHSGHHASLFNSSAQPMPRDQYEHSGSSDVTTAGSNYSASLPWGVEVYTTNDKSYTVDDDWYSTIYDEQTCLPNSSISSISSNPSLGSGFMNASNQLQNMPLDMDAQSISMQTSFGSSL